MTFDPQRLIDDLGLIAPFHSALKAAYEQGIKDGIARIVQAAQSPMSEVDYAAQSTDNVNLPDKSHPSEAGNQVRRRAKRGLLPAVMEKMLTDHPGLTASEYIDKIGEYDDTIKGNSVGNELRRGSEAGRYEKRGKRWFLKDKEIEAEASLEGKTSASNVNHDQGSNQYATTLT